MKIGERLRTQRMQNGLTQVALAEIIGCSASRISNFENNKNIEPRPELLTSITDFINSLEDKKSVITATGAQLKHARIAAGYSQAKLAIIMNCHRATIHFFESGKTRKPHPKLLKKIASFIQEHASPSSNR